MTDLTAWAGLLARTYDVLRLPVAKLDDSLLGSGTPCSEWTAGDLLEHVVRTIDMFATGAGAPESERRTTGTPAERFGAAADRNLAAWRAVTDPETAVALAFGEFPAATAAALNQFEVLVHAWDLAAALGITARLPDDLAEVALRTAEIRFRTRPRGQGFAPEVPAGGDSPQEKLLALSGRDTAGWPERR